MIHHAALRLSALAVLTVLSPPVQVLRPSRPPSDRPPATSQFFTRQILPILKSRCYECHSHDSGKIQGGLTVDSRDGLVQGGDSGPAVVPKNLAQSLLVTAIRYDDSELADAAGRKAARGGNCPAGILGQARRVRSPHRRGWRGSQRTRYGQNPPSIGRSNPWVDLFRRRLATAVGLQTPLDAFVLARLEAKKMHPAAPADKRTLIRRATSI